MHFKHKYAYIYNVNVQANRSSVSVMWALLHLDSFLCWMIKKGQFSPPPPSDCLRWDRHG